MYMIMVHSITSSQVSKQWIGNQLGKFVSERMKFGNIGGAVDMFETNYSAFIVYCINAPKLTSGLEMCNSFQMLKIVWFLFSDIFDIFPG